MRRRSMQVLFALGVLLTLAAGTMWGRGIRTTDSFAVYCGHADAGVYAEDLVTVTTNARWAGLKWQRLRRRVPADSPPGPATTRFQFEHETYRAPSPRLLGDPSEGAVWNRLGFHARAGSRRWPHDEPVWLSSSGVFASVPGWLPPFGLAAVTTVPVTVLFRMRRRQARREQGLCPACGYDLRGAEHERCPECGAGVVVAAV